MNMTKEELAGAIETIDGWGESNPETNSMIAGVGAVTGGIVALNVAPALFVTGSVVYTLFSMGKGTADYTLKRWSKGEEVQS